MATIALCNKDTHGHTSNVASTGDDLSFFCIVLPRHEYRTSIVHFYYEELDLELELIQTQLTQKPVLRAEANPLASTGSLL